MDLAIPTTPTTTMNTFWQLFRESVILQGVLTVSLWGVLLYLVVIGQEVPDVLMAGATTVLGFWFGSKVQNAINQTKQ
jgi:uncharacterized membrane protein YfcA